MSVSSSSPNRLLASLSAADFELLRPHLNAVPLVHEATLFEPGDPLDHIYFPHSGIISLVVPLTGGQMVESAMVGRDTMFGGSLAIGGLPSSNRVIVQLAGDGVTIDVAPFREIAEKSPNFRITLIRHEQALFVQAQQSAACNAAHTIEARLSRWLLRARDLSGSDKLALTQEFLAQMLGVQRSSVSIVANTLQQAGLIHYSRGRIEITNLAGLQAACCECYGTVKAHYDRVLNGAS
jgi:CRP-like cAMP-binding protein